MLSPKRYALTAFRNCVRDGTTRAIAIDATAAVAEFTGESQ
jgi:hypothetical protein